MTSHELGDLDERSTVLRGRFDPTPVPDTSFDLVVVEGPDLGKSFEIKGAEPRVLIGKGPICEIRLSDPEVSRRHATLEFAGRRLRITDADSTNGTFVDGVAVVEAFLGGSEIIRMGSTAFRLERKGASPAQLPPVMSFGPFIGGSTEVRRLYPLCERLAAANVPVIIEGETGTGKEMLAEALHEVGPRAAAPYVVFDCAAVPPNLVESELFGHERGAFTGAIATRKGVFEQAHGGTLLIDEIGDLDLALQPKLLRALERREVRRVGGDHPIKVDVRILSATRRDLDHEVQAGRFRDDLFHRLAVARIELPPLRRRRGDVGLLTRHFWREMAGDGSAPPEELLRRWEDYAWPGNVRELRNAVARQIALGTLADMDASTPIVASESAGPAAPAGDLVDRVLALGLPLGPARQRVIDDFDRRYVERALVRHEGNVARAAEEAGVARRYFQLLRARKLK